MGIKPSKVERSEGFYTHPDVPDWGEYVPDDVLKKWAYDNGIILTINGMEDDFTAPEGFVEKWFDDGLSDCSPWNPQPPAKNSFLLSIHDTEEGPYVWWATPL